MAYSSATFFLDLESGSDSARTALTTAIASNPSGTITRINKTAHGLTTGAVVDLTLFTAWLNSAWKITRVDADNFDLDAAVWQTTADNNGTVTPRGGSSKADAWRTVTSGVTAARHQAGDTIRVKATTAETLVGNATWTDLSKTVTLAGAVTANITDCENPWIASSNVTCSSDTTTFKENSKAMKAVFAGAFTTGLAAYYAPYTVNSPAISNRAVSLLGAASLTLGQSVSADEGMFQVSLPFYVLYNGQYFNAVTVSSNSFMVFANTSSNTFVSISATNPALPNIQIGAADNSYQRVYSGTEGTKFRIRYEGANSTSGTPGSPTIVWEITFDSLAPGTIKIDIGTNTYRASPASGCSDGVGSYFATFASGISNTGYTLTQTGTPLTLDLSGYQQVSFWLRNDIAVAASTLSLRLCSDTVGATTVHTVTVPAIPGTGRFIPMTIDFGTNLNSTINSVALYADLDPGALTLQIDNIIACKAASSDDSLTLQSLIGKVWNLVWVASSTYAANTIRKPTQPNRNGYRYKVTAGGGGAAGSSEPSWPAEIGVTVADGALTWTCEGLEDTWYGIQSINGTTLKLDNDTNTFGNAGRGYTGTTETVATYKREPYNHALIANNFTVNTTNTSGTLAAYITYTGGWDRTDMLTQNGETWCSVQSGGSYSFSQSLSYLAYRNWSYVRANYGWFTSSVITATSFQNCHYNNNSGGGWSNQGVSALHELQGVVINNNGSVNAGLLVAGANSGWRTTLRAVAANNNMTHGIRFFQAVWSRVSGIDVVAKNNNGYGLHDATDGPNTRISNLLTANNASGGVLACDAGGPLLINASLADSTPYVVSTTAGESYLYLHKYQQSVDAHVIAMDGGNIVSATDQRHTASGISWKFRPTAVTRNSLNPLRQPLAKIACAASVAVTVSIWTRRDSTNVNGTLKVAGGQLAGVNSDVTTACAPSINTWTQYSLSFTPSEVGVVEVSMECYDGVGTTNSFWIDDLAVS